jgi:hypothetical protein
MLSDAGFATEMVCLDALQKAFRQGDANGGERWSRVALPEGIPPIKEG